MSYITRNANILLLFLIIFSAAALVGATVYFQLNFDRINGAYTLKMDQLNKVSDELEAKQFELKKLSDDLSLKSQREEQLSGQYTEVRTEKEGLETQKKKLTTEKLSLQEELEKTEQTLYKTQNDLAAKKALAAELTAEKDKLVLELDLVKDDRDRLEADIADLGDLVDCLETTADDDENGC